MKITKLETIWFEAVPDAAWRQQSPHSRQALPNNLSEKIYVFLGSTRADCNVVDTGDGVIHRLASREIKPAEKSNRALWSAPQFL